MSTEGPSPSAQPPVDWRLRVPDHVLLRRYGYVRTGWGGVYFLLVAAAFAVLGWQAWPLLVGLALLVVVTTGYFARSTRYPRTAVLASLVADVFVLAGAVAFFGGTGSGLLMLYAIVLVSAGLLLGPSSALAFTGLCLLLGLAQLGLEQAGVEPALLHRQPLDERLPVLLVSLGGLAGVGYLSAIYASRLQELVMLAGQEAESLRVRGLRRRSFARQASAEARAPFAELERVADALDVGCEPLDASQRRRLAARLRMGVTRLEAEVDQLVDLGLLDTTVAPRPRPLELRRVVEDGVIGLADRLEAYEVQVDVPPVKVLGEGRAVRRIVHNLLENVVDHTPPGTRVHVTAVTTPGQGVLVVTDDGPGIAEDRAPHVFDPPDEARASARPWMGLPLVGALAEQMGGQARCEAAPTGGARVLVAFRLAPSAAPSEEAPTPAGSAAAGGDRDVVADG